MSPKDIAAFSTCPQRRTCTDSLKMTRSPNLPQSSCIAFKISPVNFSSPFLPQTCLICCRLLLLALSHQHPQRPGKPPAAEQQPPAPASCGQNNSSSERPCRTGSRQPHSARLKLLLEISLCCGAIRDSKDSKSPLCPTACFGSKF